MAQHMLKKEVEVYSEKYDVHGVIRDYGVVTKLFFTYRGREIVMGISNWKDEAYEDRGRKYIDSYIFGVTLDFELRYGCGLELL